MKKIGGILLIIVIAIIGSGISRANNTLEMMSMYEILEDAPDYDLEDHCKEIEVDESGYMEDEITVISRTHHSISSYDGSDIVTNTTVEDDDIVHGKSSKSLYDYYNDDEDYEYDMYNNYYDYLDDSEYDLEDYYYIDNDEYYDDGLEYEEDEYYLEEDEDDYDLIDDWEYEEDDEYWDEDEEWYDEDDEYYYDEYDWYE